MGDNWYVDTSALTKLLVTERETRALQRWIQGKTWAVSDLQRTELRRALLRSDEGLISRADDVLNSATVIRITPELFDVAGRLRPPELRSLDALHLAAALSLGDDLAGIATYDARLIDAARMASLTVASPGGR